MRKRSGWRLRPLIPNDASMLREWIAADPNHAGRFDAEWWLQKDSLTVRRAAAGEPVPIVENYLAVDKEGPLLFLRCSNAMRLEVQFSPLAEFRIATTLGAGMPWLANEARKRRYAQIIYESRSARMVRFLERIGFRETSTEHVLCL